MTRGAGLSAVIPPPGFPALATRPAATAVAARAMAPWGGRAVPIRAKLAVTLRPGLARLTARPARADRAPGGRGRLLLGFLLGAALA